MEWLINNWEMILGVISGIITVASIVVKATPTTVDDEYLAKVLRILELLALNNKPVEVNSNK